MFFKPFSLPPPPFFFFCPFAGISYNPWLKFLQALNRKGKYCIYLSLLRLALHLLCPSSPLHSSAIGCVQSPWSKVARLRFIVYKVNLCQTSYHRHLRIMWFGVIHSIKKNSFRVLLKVEDSFFLIFIADINDRREIF